MRTRHLLVAAAIGAAALIPATADGATLRVVSGSRTVLSVTQINVGSTRSYLDTTGRAHRLKANTVLGQLVAATAFWNTYLRINYASGLGAYVTTIAGVKAPKHGYWELFVNGEQALLGADSTQVKRTDHVLWLADTDYTSTNGPWLYELTSTDNGDGTVTFAGRKIGGLHAVPAKGATLLVDGVEAAVLDSHGTATVTHATGWNAKLAGTARILGSPQIYG